MTTTTTTVPPTTGTRPPSAAPGPPSAAPGPSSAAPGPPSAAPGAAGPTPSMTPPPGPAPGPAGPAPAAAVPSGGSPGPSGGGCPRAEAVLAGVSAPVTGVWSAVRAAAAAGPSDMGLAAGDRPAAEVEVLAAACAAAEYTLAACWHAAGAAGALPLTRGGMLTARGWSPATARRLARAGALAAAHPRLAATWAAGTITAEHVDAVARRAERFTTTELAAVLAQLDPLWGRLSPAAVARFVTAAEQMLHPPPDPPTSQETDAYTQRHLSFALLGDTVLLTGQLPRLEGEAVIAAIEALAEQRRTTTTPTPPATRRADALLELVQRAATADLIPTRGGLPVALTITLHTTPTGDTAATTSRGHHLTPAETRWTCCQATTTPIQITTPTSRTTNPANQPTANPASPGEDPGRGPTGCPGRPSPTQRITALAAALLDTHQPLAVGRTARTATPAQRRALAIRDRGCIIPGCPAPPETCQTHHLTPWANGGTTDLDHLALLCWTHHRQVDLNMWTITPTPTPHPPAHTSPTTGTHTNPTADTTADTNTRAHADTRATADPGQGPDTTRPTHHTPTTPPLPPWPANNGAPFTITPTRRARWRP